MRRAQQAVTASRPYAEHIQNMLADLGQVTLKGGTVKHPLLEQRTENNIGIVLMTSDRGLAGAFNANAIRTTTRFIREHGDQNISLIPAGRKGRDYARRFGYNVTEEYTDLGDRPDESAILPAARTVIQRFSNRELDSVYLVYTEYISTISQKAQLVRLLPVEPPEADEGESRNRFDYTYEPDDEALLNALLPRYVEVRLYQALLESKASEFAARMVAMRNATDNANELVDRLTLTMNKVRQATITTEILEITGGAEALKQGR